MRTKPPGLDTLMVAPSVSSGGNQPTGGGQEDDVVTQTEVRKDDMRSSTEDTYKDGEDTGMAR